MYYREVKGCKGPSTMLMLTKGDAIFAADQLQRDDSAVFYEAKPRFLGYEGADYGVTVYAFGHFSGYAGNFLRWVNDRELQNICKDRPIVKQANSWKS